MTSVVTIYGKSFSIGFSEADDARRKSYFKNRMGTLTPQEKSLLLAFGIDSMLENSLKPYLTKFFSSLQTCTSDASLALMENCEVSRFIIWSALFYNNGEVRRRFKGTKGDPIDIELAQDAAIVAGLKPKAPPPPPYVSENTIRELFTLKILGDTPAASAAAIQRLFTLMTLDPAEEAVIVDEEEEE